MWRLSRSVDPHGMDTVRRVVKSTLSSPKHQGFVSFALLFIALITIDTESGVITEEDSIPRVSFVYDSFFISYSVKIIYKTNSSCSSKEYIYIYVYISIRGTDIIFSITNWRMTSTNKLPVTWNCPRLDHDVGMTEFSSCCVGESDAFHKWNCGWESRCKMLIRRWEKWAVKGILSADLSFGQVT